MNQEKLYKCDCGNMVLEMDSGYCYTGYTFCTKCEEFVILSTKLKTK